MFRYFIVNYNNACLNVARICQKLNANNNSVMIVPACHIWCVAARRWCALVSVNVMHVRVLI